ncbi:MAG: AAA family ATPase [Chryseobacterium sp.]|nr:AAA family ATPase [Chryseobacterium sp.]
MKTISAQQALSKTFETFEFDGIWKEVFGNPENTGIWYVGGGEKHGKSTFMMMLAKYLAQHDKETYVSAEEGLSKDIIRIIKSVGITDKDKNLKFLEYMPWEELTIKMGGNKSGKIWIIDNTTIYRDELTRKLILAMKQKFTDGKNKNERKLIIFISHEEKGQPDNAISRMIRKLAKIIIQVEGLKAEVSGRCPGGEILIDEEKALLYHGTRIENQ